MSDNFWGVWAPVLVVFIAFLVAFGGIFIADARRPRLPKWIRRLDLYVDKSV